MRQRVINHHVRKRHLERCAIEGDSPVSENTMTLKYHPSSVGHVKSGMNPCRPLHKAKYFFTPIAYSTVRERLKEPLIGEWNRSWNSLLTREVGAYGWPRTYWRMGQRVIDGSKVKAITAESGAKASSNRALVAINRPETLWATHDQDDMSRNRHGGPNGLELQVLPMNCVLEWKAYRTTW